MKEQGLSLLELLTTLTIVSIFTVLAVPATTQWIRQQDVQTSTELLTRSLALARQEAVTRRMSVSMVANESWQQGWQVFADVDGDAELDADDALIQVQMPLPNVIIQGNTSASKYIMYNEDGRSIPAGGTGNSWVASTITICVSASPDIAYNVVIAKGGRARIEKLPNQRCS